MTEFELQEAYRSAQEYMRGWPEWKKNILDIAARQFVETAREMVDNEAMDEADRQTEKRKAFQDGFVAALRKIIKAARNEAEVLLRIGESPQAAGFETLQADGLRRAILIAEDMLSETFE